MRLMFFRNSSEHCVSLELSYIDTFLFFYPSSIWKCVNRNHATIGEADVVNSTIPKFKFSRSTSLQVLIGSFKSRIENKSRLSKADLQLLLNKLQAHKANSNQALDILQCCAHSRIDNKDKDIVLSIWNELKKQNVEYQINHYKCLLTFYRDIRDVEQTQTVFDEMVQAGLTPDAWVTLKHSSHYSDPLNILIVASFHFQFQHHIPNIVVNILQSGIHRQSRRNSGHDG